MQLDRLRPVPIMLAFLMVATACGGGDTVRGVQVRDLSTDIGLGIEKDEETGGGPTSRGLGGGGLGGTFIPPKFEFEAEEIDRVDRGSSEACVEAGPFDFPDRGAETGVRGRPQEFASRWVVEGTAQIGDTRHNIRLLTGQREVRNVQSNPISEDAYTFEVKELLPASSVEKQTEVITRWIVLPRGPSEQAGVQNDVPSAADAAEREADQAGFAREDEGVYLTYYETRVMTQPGDPEVFGFTPSPPIQYLSFPVRQGGYIDSTGTDGATSMRIQGRIERRRHVDACGKKLDSWYVNAVQTWRFGASTETYNYDYGIATQFGGIIVSECYELPVGENPDRVCHDDPIPDALEKPSDPVGRVAGTEEGCSAEQGETPEEEQANEECRAEERKRQAEEEEQRRERMKRMEDPDLRWEFRIGELPPPVEEF